MSTRNTAMMMIFVAAAALLAGCKDTKKNEEPEAVLEETIKSPSDSTVIDEIWFFFNGDVQKNLKLAHSTFASKDYESMIHGIQKAEAIMKLEGLRASGQNKMDLDKSIKQMEKLANDVHNKVFVPTPEYEKAFGYAQYALGKIHFQKAKEMWDTKNYFKTGQELFEGTLNLENAYLWVDHRIDSTSTKALDRSSKLASELMNDEGWAPVDVSSVFKSMDSEISKLKGEVKA